MRAKAVIPWRARSLGAGVFDEHAVCSVLGGQNSAHSGLKLRIVDPFAPDVDEIPSLVVANEPRRADRKVVLRSFRRSSVSQPRRRPLIEDEKAFSLGAQASQAGSQTHHRLKQKDHLAAPSQRRYVLRISQRLRRRCAFSDSSQTRGPRSREASSPRWRVRVHQSSRRKQRWRLQRRRNRSQCCP